MAMPPRDPGNLLVADWAEALLLLPEVAEPPSPLEPSFHLHVETFFKIRFPSRIVRVRFTISCRAVRSRRSLIRFLIFRRNGFTLFFDGVMKNLGRFLFLYFRIVCPRKSNPCSICVMTVFSGDNSNPRSWRKCSTRGL